MTFTIDCWDWVSYPNKRAQSQVWQSVKCLLYQNNSLVQLPVTPICRVLSCCYFLPCGNYMFKAPRLHHSNSPQEPLCLYLVLLPLENFIMQVERILFQFQSIIYALPVLFLALKKCAKVVSHHFSLTCSIKGEKHYCIVLPRQNLFFQEIRDSNCKTIREAKLQNKWFFHHPATVVRNPSQYIQNNSIKWVTSS